MISFLYSLLGFVVAIGLLTTIHEYGHFWTARRLGIKVLRFSIGFGKILYSWHDKRGTQYSISAIPLGGYVKMLDQNEGKVAPEELHLAFNRKPIWKRILVIAAGPICNLAFAVLAFWFVLVWGTSAMIPVLGDIATNTPAYAAGLRSGQEIVAIDGKVTRSWEDVIVALASHAGDENKVDVAVRDFAQPQGSTQNYALQVPQMEQDKTNFMHELGFVPYDPLEPIVGKVLPNYPAAQVGLKAGDLIMQIDGQQTKSISQLMQIVQNKYEQRLTIRVKRANEFLDLYITPVKKEQEDGAITGFLGVQFAKQKFPAKFIRVQRYAPLHALHLAVDRTYSYISLTLQFIGKMITGKMSLQHISGPIAIAQYAGITVRAGIENFVNFLALVSISLGVLNLLPIPVLDGGHILFCIIEAVRGKALSKRSTNVGFAMGVLLLGSIMLLAIYNDVLRILH